MPKNEPMFPILGDPCVKAVPLAFMAPHEAQAQRNHGQSLNTLARRGGLDCGEAEAAVLGRRLSFGSAIPESEHARARANLMKLVWLFERERENANASRT